MPRGLILGPIIFNIFLSDLFLVINDVNFTSNARLFQWFPDNRMKIKGKSDKCDFISSTNVAHQILVGNSSIACSSCNKLLGVKTDSKLTFDHHVKDMHEG